VSRVARLLLSCLGLPCLLAGCQVGVLAAPLPPSAPVEAEPGVYADDPRWEAFVRAWPQRAGAALDRLQVVTGLTFEEGMTPRLVLRPLGDERVPYEIRAEIVDGRRRPVIHVNAEPLLAGVRDPARVLLRALATAALEDAARRHGAATPWVVALAATAAASELDARLAALQRRVVEGDAHAARVDAKDASAAEATGLAALALLAERGQPDDVRRVLRYVADGDDPGKVLGRQAGEPDGNWQRPARLALRTRLAEYDPEPWRLLARARVTAAETGRSGLTHLLPAKLPGEIADEVRVLRARAAADEGAYDEARARLAELTAQAPSRLRDPAGTLALRIRLEMHKGGDAAKARRLAGQLERDFPRSHALADFRAAHPLLGMEEDPQQWLVAMGRRIAATGSADLDLETVGRYARMLLLDHRAGAAERFLASLGERGAAPELEGLHTSVRDGQADPSEAAITRNAKRVDTWHGEPTEAHAQDVRDGGNAARGALVSLIARGPVLQRAPAVRLLVGTIGAAPAVAAVRRLWSLDVRRVDADLTALATAVPFGPLEAAREDSGMDADTTAVVARAWARLTLDLDVAWLRAHPAFLRHLHDARFPTRRDALAALAKETPRRITPALVAHVLRDKAALLRREGVVLARRAGFRALARRALEDRAWLVRREAVVTVAALEGRAAVPLLIRLLRKDESRAIRAAAAQALLKTAPEEPRVIDALLATQVGEEARLRDAIATRLAEQEPAPVVRGIVRGIVRGWRRALQRAAPDRGYLFRTALLYERVTEDRVGYYPGASAAELRKILAAMEAWLGRTPRTTERAR